MTNRLLTTLPKASGIFATMKAALSTENGEIPGVHGFKTLNPEIKDKEWNVKIAEKLIPWPADFDVRRASVSSFGYGGTNAHLIVESIESICPWYEHGKPKESSEYKYDGIDRPFLVTMSAHDEKTLLRNIETHQKIARDYHLPDLAYTLNCRRTQFAARGYIIVSPDGLESDAFEANKFSYGSVSKPANKPNKLGFVLTGQGAQWARMGVDAMERFPDFAETIEALDRVLKSVDPRPTWTLREVLQAPAESSRVGEAEISQPACTAIQIAIIDLFASWGIEPAVTVGHSSGEIAAAYAAGRISAPKAILAAYFRGFAVARAAPVGGTMLAVGLGADEIEDYIPEEVAEQVTIACENSPNSVTLSGSLQDVALVKDILNESNVFNRQLKTGMSYHSPYMDDVAPLYAELYTMACGRLTEAHHNWRRPCAGMVSSVTGLELDIETWEEIPIEYWCNNLRSRVQFNAAVRELGKSAQYADVNVLVEIGPHPALGGPIKQICTANHRDMHCIASLVRGFDGATALLKTAGELYLRGLEVDFEAVNSMKASAPTPVAMAFNKKRNIPRYLPDLPPYSWNYEKTYWNQPRTMAELRQSKYPRHDILGRRIFGLSTNVSTWINILRQRDVSWLVDHVLGTDVVFPAAGHLSLAIEALLQQLDLDPQGAGGVKFRDVDIKKALIIPETDDGIEIHTRLQSSGGSDWYAFSVESVDDGRWTIHSTGKIQRQQQQQQRQQQQQPQSCPKNLSQLHQQVPAKRWYQSLGRVGFHYGAHFQTMKSVRANGRDRVAAAGVQVQTECGAIEHESRYMMHPSTLDGCLHVVIASVHRGLHREMPWGVVPLEMEEVNINFPAADDLDVEGRCMAWTERAWDRYLEENVELLGKSGRCILNIRGLKLVVYDAAVPVRLKEPRPKEPYRHVVWEKASKGVSDSLQTRFKVDGNVAVVVAPNNNCTALGHALGSKFFPLPVSSVDVDDFDKVVIDDSTGSILASTTAESFESIKKMLTSGKPTVWVTRGVNQGDSVEGGIPQGLLRAVRSELISPNITLVDADQEASVEHLASLVQYQLSSIEDAIRESGVGDDAEFWLTKHATVLVPRIETNEVLNSLFHKETPYTSAAITPDDHFKGRILSDEVVFESRPPTQALEPSEVEIQVLFSEVIKDDLSAARASERARIITGTVVRAGVDLNDSLRGQAVVAYTRKTFESRVVTQTFAEVDVDQLKLVTASFPHLCKAVNAVLRVANASAGDHVLLLPAPAPFENAVTKLGQHFGFRVSIAHDNAADLQRIFSSLGGSPPNIVVAGSPSTLVSDAWRAMPRCSRFVLSDVAIDSSLDPKPFNRGVTMSVCSISDLFEKDQTALLQVLTRSVEIFVRAKDGLFSVPSPPSIDVEELLSIEDARDSVPESETAVMSINYGQSEVKVGS